MWNSFPEEWKIKEKITHAVVTEGIFMKKKKLQSYKHTKREVKTSIFLMLPAVKKKNIKMTATD